MSAVSGGGLAGYYRRLPDEVRRCLRPLAGMEELASFLPPRVRDPVWRATEMGRRAAHLRRVRYAVRRLEGHAANGAPLTALLACDELSARYWMQALFPTAPRAEVVGTIGAVATLRGAGRLQDGIDLSLCQAPWPLARFAPRAMQIPSWIPLWLPTNCTMDAIVMGDRAGRSSRKDDARRVRRAALQTRLVRDAAAVDRFYHEMYAPYVRARFGTLGIMQPRHAFHHTRRHGWLLLLEDATGPRSGALLEPHGAELRLVALAAASDGDAQVAIESAYYHAIRVAVEGGFARLALGTSRPVLTDGVLRYKRKWGGRLEAPTTFDRYLLRARFTPAVRSVLTATPMVVDRGGGLAALVGHEGVDAEALLARVDVPGLAEILLAGPHDGPMPPAPHTPVRALPAGTAA